MLKLSDFYHLPQLDATFDRMISEGPGLMILAGIEVRPGVSNAANDESDPGETILPSGLAGFFDVLVQTMLMANPVAQAVIVAREKSLGRVSRQLKRRVKLLPVEGGQSYDRQIQTALTINPALLVVDNLTVESVPAVFHAASNGLKVIASIDSALCGAGVVRHLLSLGVQPEQLAAMTMILSMQRLPALCTHCRTPRPAMVEVLNQVCEVYPHLAETVRVLCYQQDDSLDEPRLIDNLVFYTADGCAHCHGTGRSGDVAVFDSYHAREGNNTGGEDGLSRVLIRRQSDLSQEEYAFRLALQGTLDLDDVLWLPNDQLRRIYNHLSSSGQALSETSSALSRKLFELEASNRVLVQRTEVLMSLEDLGKALIESVDLKDLAKRVCRRAGDLCGADRVILYLLRTQENESDQAEVLAVHGWEEVETAVLDAQTIFEPTPRTKVERYILIPPGVKVKQKTDSGEAISPGLQTGLRVPLMAQDRWVGVMVIQSTQKGFFTPGETALLQTFANQAALAIQRAGLVDDLRHKIAELEAAQEELVMKERMERELELARQVQQSLLPKEFPQLPGYFIAARNQPARQVGGDFYDVIILDNDHFGIVMADVSDKGMPAAMYMGLSRSLILAEAHRGLSPREALLNVNRLLLELGELGGFVSVLYGVIDIPNQRMRYTRAGHERPVLLRSSAANESERIVRLPGDGTVLGVLESDELRLTEQEVALQQGDRIVLHTDGLTDITNADNQFYGSEQFTQLLSRIMAGDADQICEEIFRELAVFRGDADPFDDMTLLVVAVDQRSGA